MSPVMVGAVIVGLAVPLAAQEIRLWPEGTSAGDVIRLRDVAQIGGADADTIARLGRLPVRTVTEAVGESVVDLANIRATLAEAGSNLAHVRLCGAARCIVRHIPTTDAPAPVATVIPTDDDEKERSAQADARDPASAETLEIVVRRHLEKQLAANGGRVLVRFSPISANALKIAGPDVRLDVRNANANRLGLVGLEVEVQSPGQPARRVQVTAEVSLTRPVVVARRPLNQGTRIKSSDVGLEDRTFTRWEDIGLTDPTAAIGQEARAFVRAGEQLRVSQLREPALVRRGDLVTIWARRGGLVVKTVGRAQAGGARGEVIAVKAEGTRELIRAAIEGPKTVTLEGSMQVAAR